MRISDWSSDVCSSDLLLEQSVDTKPDRQIEDHADHCGGDRRKRGRQCAVAAQPLDEWRAGEDPQEAWQEGNPGGEDCAEGRGRSEEHTSELQSLMSISYAVFCLKKKTEHY